MSNPTEYKSPRKRYWLILRIIDNRLQALAPSDPADPTSDVDWTDLGAETSLYTDREDAFQTGRANGGLLVSADGLPGPHRMAAFHDVLRARRAADVQAVAPTEDEPAETVQAAKPSGPKPLPKASGDASRQYKAQVPAKDDAPPL